MNIFGYEITRRNRVTDITLAEHIKDAKNALKRQTDGNSNVIKTARAVPKGQFVRNKDNPNLSGTPDKNNRLYSDNPDFSALGGRKTNETNQTWSNFDFFNAYAARKKKGVLGLSSTFDIKDFETWDFDYLAELLAELSPEVSKAVWDFLLMCNPGYTCKAFRPKSKEIYQAAQDEVDLMLATVGHYNGTLGVFFDRIFKMIFLRGSYLMELVLDDRGKEFVDIATPDTKTLEYKRDWDERRGQIWAFGQYQNGQFVKLSGFETIKYIPVHPLPDSIEGVPLCSSAFFVAIFLMAILRDTKRVVQHQGYMRLDVQVNFEQLKDTMPEDIEGNPKEVLRWMNETIDSVKSVYEQLEPTDTYIHPDSIQINAPVGTVDAGSLQAIDALFGALERMAVRALKTMPLLLGTNQSRSETQANREWEIYAKGIEIIQHLVESGFEYIIELALQAKGILADVDMKFDTFRAAEKMRDRQVEYLQDKIARFLYDCGIISQDEMAVMSSANKEKADQTEPRSSGTTNVGGNIANSGQNPNEGESRIVNPEMKEMFERMLDFLRNPSPNIDDAKEFFRFFSPELSKELFPETAKEAEETA